MNQAHLEKMQAARKATVKQSIMHTVKTVDGGERTFTHYLLSQAVAIHCTKCMGDETDPEGCTSRFCALFPFRRKTRAHNHAERHNGVVPSL